jgi:23S rRNA (adenine2503-C2)-methyltransferase
MAEKRGRKQTDKPGNDRPTGGAGRPQAPKPPGGAGRPTGTERRPATDRPTETDRPNRPGRSSGPGQPAGQARPSHAVRTATPRAAARPKPGPKAGPRPAPIPKRDDSPQAVLALYRPDLAKTLAAAEAPSFRYAQVLEHLMRRPGTPLAQASNLPVALRATLDHGGPSVLTVAATRKAPDGTTKLLLTTRDGENVETVLLPYGKRLTVCISSQVGCAVGCVFCATGALGFRRNLSTAEIVDQVRAAATVCEPEQRLTNVVYMGMGEPLLNLGAVIESVRVLTAPSGLGLGRRSLSISTVGIPSGILRLAKFEPQVNLALSLHAADDVTRAHLIPEQFRHPLSEILDAAWQHFEITRRKLLVEYVLIQGVNDTVDDARRLAALLRGHVVTVNLLAWNPVNPEEHADPGTAAPGDKKPPRRRTFLPSSPATLAAFRGTLRAAHIEAVVRQSKGAGIEAACGQLAGAAQSYEESPED